MGLYLTPYKHLALYKQLWRPKIFISQMPFKTVQPTATLGTVQPTATLGTVQPTATLGTVQPTATLGTVQPTATLGTVQPTATLGTSQLNSKDKTLLPWGYLWLPINI